MQDEQSWSDGLASEEYDRLALVEDLESILEEMEENGVTGLEDSDRLSAESRERLASLDIKDLQQLRSRIMHLHAEIDDDDRDLTITDS
jgi:hypothetical protein